MKSRQVDAIGDGNHRPVSPAMRVETTGTAPGIFSTPFHIQEA
jgi:hypothetical protein